jgi:hypothetical protein
MKRVSAVFSAVALAFALAARADDIEVVDARLAVSDEAYTLSADFAFKLNARLVEAVANGIALYFVVDFELTRRRWYWFDDKAADKRLQIRLSYWPLTRQYRLSTGVLHQNYATLEEALNVLRRVRGWQVLERSAPLAEANYEAAVRMRLDTTLLPKPFQLSAITSRELNLESPWQRFIFRPPAPPPAPVETREPKQTKEAER